MATMLPGLYLDRTTNTILDTGDNTAVDATGTISLTNNTVRLYGVAQGRLEWITTGTNATTSQVRYISWDGETEWGPVDWGYATSSSTTISAEWTWHDDGLRLAKVVRGAYDPQSGWIHASAPDPMKQIRKIIQQRCAPVYIRNIKCLDHAPDIREIRARETLRRVVGAENYRRFLKRGFITVMNPKSGNTFQIFPGHGITNVYFRGTMVERLCVVMKGDFPPTDSLIMRYLMILNNEEQFRALAVKHSVFQTQKQVLAVPDQRSLPEIFANLRTA
jgi:hypothetical protein